MAGNATAQAVWAPPSCESETLTQCVGKLVPYYQGLDGVPDVMVSVVVGGKPEYKRAFGPVGGSRPPLALDTSFQIDSLTKVFTAIAVMHMAEDQRVNLDDTLSDHPFEIGSQPMPQWWQDLTIDRLLGMSSGLPDRFATKPYLKILEDIIDLQRTFEAGNCYQYSNPNYLLLGMLIDTVSGRSYEDFLNEFVLGPSGFNLPNTGLIADPPNKAEPHGNGARWRPPGWGYSAGGFVSTINDLETFAIGLHERKVLQVASYDRMWTRFHVCGKNCTGCKVYSTSTFGRGWLIPSIEDGTVVRVQKNGGGAGWGAQMVYSLPDPDVCVSVLANANTGHIGQLANCIADAAVRRAS